MIFYYFLFISWLNYFSVAFYDEAKFSASVFVQNHLFDNPNI